MSTRGRIWSIPGSDLVLQQLTERELEVLRQVAAGHRNREIAKELNVSVKTVEFHLSNILGKLSARSRTEAVVRAGEFGMLALTGLTPAPPPGEPL